MKGILNPSPPLSPSILHVQMLLATKPDSDKITLCAWKLVTLVCQWMVIKAWIRRDFSNSNKIRIEKSCSDFIRIEEKTTFIFFIIFYFAILLLGLWGWSISAFVHHSWSQSVTRLACTSTQGCIFSWKIQNLRIKIVKKSKITNQNSHFFKIYQFKNII